MTQSILAPAADGSNVGGPVDDYLTACLAAAVRAACDRHPRLTPQRSPKPLTPAPGSLGERFNELYPEAYAALWHASHRDRPAAIKKSFWLGLMRTARPLARARDARPSARRTHGSRRSSADDGDSSHPVGAAARPRGRRLMEVVA